MFSYRIRHREAASFSIVLFLAWCAIVNWLGAGVEVQPIAFTAGIAAGLLLHELVHIAFLMALGVRRLIIRPLLQFPLMGLSISHNVPLEKRSFAVEEVAPILTLTPILLSAARLTGGALRSVLLGASLINTIGSSGDLLLIALVVPFGNTKVLDRGVLIEVSGCRADKRLLIPVIMVDYFAWALISVFLALFAAMHLFSSS
ncbi:MAG: DUF3267 domain-containing protein [Candidatus Korarchaeota archaeon NZ13-K]|nr:MAG: DUF3267 domain-containing protein [Candidatus Korarchaeota archaeon NZ13-K]